MGRRQRLPFYWGFLGWIPVASLRPIGGEVAYGDSSLIMDWVCCGGAGWGVNGHHQTVAGWLQIFFDMRPVVC